MPTVIDGEEKDRKPQEPAAQNGAKAKPEESSGQKPGESPNGKGQGDESALVPLHPIAAIGRTEATGSESDRNFEFVH